MARQQPLQSDLGQPVGVPQTLAGLIAMENARNYAPSQTQFTPQQAQQFDQMARAGQSDLEKWAQQQQDRREKLRQWSAEFELKKQQLAGKPEIVQTEQGMFTVDPRTGKAKPVTLEGIQGYSSAPQQRPEMAQTLQPMQQSQAPAAFGAKTKPMTEEQAKATGYGTRAATSHEILNYVGKDGKVQPGLIKRFAEGLPGLGFEANQALGTGLNWTQSAAQQQVEQAQRDFINAVLRRESGAVISDAEFDNARKQYFPQPGDSEAVIAQKKQNRETTIGALETGAGPGARQVTGARQKMQMIFEAQKAVSQGASRDAVKARLEQMGITNHGL